MSSGRDRRGGTARGMVLIRKNRSLRNVFADARRGRDGSPRRVDVDAPVTPESPELLLLEDLQGLGCTCRSCR
jgi:hypothetical protein